ncbi:MAG TPA: hypothetical protein VGN61_02175 [Verrucomicrobiae bacterium]|jgi:hypothetical protein
MKCNVRKYVLRMGAGFIGYCVGLFALNYLDGEHLAHRRWLVLLPLVPLIYLVATIVRYVSEVLDEMMRKVVTEAMAFSGFATGFTCFTYLFLRDMGAPEFHAEWAFYMMWIYYGIGALFSWRRYG